jgi:homoserine O-succinyltransferase/O-acetyltransferase
MNWQKKYLPNGPGAILGFGVKGGLCILAESDEAGVQIVASDDGRRVFGTGNAEYDPLTRRSEYDRELNKGLSIHIPANYYPAGDPSLTPSVRWHGYAHLFFVNWLNYCAYQVMPYNIREIPEHATIADF